MVEKLVGYWVDKMGVWMVEKKVEKKEELWEMSLVVS